MQIFRLVLTSLFLLVLSSPSGWGLTGDPEIYFLGEEIKLSIKQEAGRYYGLRQEMVELLSDIPLASAEAGQSNSLAKWLPLRAFWEEQGFRVIWLPRINVLIISDNTTTGSLPQEAQSLIQRAVADTDWLIMNNKEKLEAHLKGFYTPELAESLVKETWNFIQVETDWHGTYQLEETEIIDEGKGWYLLKLVVKEYPSPEAKPLLMEGIMKLEYLEVGWRIGAYQYYQ